jgi:hypothetical protein
MILNIFFSIKLIRQFREAKKISKGGQTTENITEKYYFLKFREAATPEIVCIRPCLYITVSALFHKESYFPNAGHGAAIN